MILNSTDQNMDHSHGAINAPPEGTTASSGLDAKAHPITGPMLHNATRSPLARLPENILLRIMEYADDVSILCLRRTCRAMFWLLSSAGDDSGTNRRQFGRVFDGAFGQYLPRSGKYVSRPEKVPESAKSVLRTLLQKDMYCQACRHKTFNYWEVRKRLESRKLYCSGCKKRHRAGLFSQEQRRQWSNKDRVCIGRQGYIRVCQHHTISWEEVETFMASPTERLRTLTCNDWSHSSIFAQSPCWEEHDHRVWITLNKDSAPNPLPLCCSGLGIRAVVPPGIGSQAWLTITWSTHISFSSENKTFDYDQALAKVEWARNIAGGSYLFQDPPAGKSKYPMEMKLFDPNIFPYLDLPPPPPLVAGAIGPSSWKWPPMGTVGSNGEQARGACKVQVGAMLQESFGSKVEDWQKNQGNQAMENVWTMKCYTQKTTASTRFHCRKFNYHKSIPLNGPFTQHLPFCYNYRPRNGGAQGQDKKPKTQTQPWSAAWFMSLDPDSIGLRGDTETRGIYWCDTESCLNYYQNHRHNHKRRALDTSGEFKREGLRARLGDLLGIKRDE